MLGHVKHASESICARNAATAVQHTAVQCVNTAINKMPTYNTLILYNALLILILYATLGTSIFSQFLVSVYSSYRKMSGVTNLRTLPDLTGTVHVEEM